MNQSFSNKFGKLNKQTTTIKPKFLMKLEKKEESTKDIWKNALRNHGLSLSSSSSFDEIDLDSDDIFIESNISQYNKKYSKKEQISSISLKPFTSFVISKNYNENHSKIYKNHKNKVINHHKYHDLTKKSENISKTNSFNDFIDKSNSFYQVETKPQFNYETTQTNIDNSDNFMSDSQFEEKLNLYKERLAKKKEETKQILEEISKKKEKSHIHIQKIQKDTIIKQKERKGIIKQNDVAGKENENNENIPKGILKKPKKNQQENSESLSSISLKKERKVIIKL